MSKIILGFLLFIILFIYPYFGLSLFLIVVAYLIYEHLYFRSKKFIEAKNSIQKHTDDCNELNQHLAELKGSFLNIESYDYGTSNLQDASKFNYKRREWSKNLKNDHIHNCSATVCKNASEQPFKYLCKYFNIKVDESTLESFETVLNDFSAADQGKKLLLTERDNLVEGIKNKIPYLIFSISYNKLIRKLGFEKVDLDDLHYPIYTFQYVSPGGNSSAKCDIKLDLDNLERFVKYLNELVKFRKSVEGQRALMTSKLREEIKERDNYTCKSCDLSTETERNLLLEIDHIIPLSKGGITTESNLQTLCWRCNRSKGSKIVPAV
jgi:hypothetical protein